MERFPVWRSSTPKSVLCSSKLHGINGAVLLKVLGVASLKTCNFPTFPHLPGVTPCKAEAHEFATFFRSLSPALGRFPSAQFVSLETDIYQRVVGAFSVDAPYPRP
jgi:hypothetical protein